MRTSRLPHFLDNRLTDGSDVVGSFLVPISVRAEKTPGPIATGRMRSTEKSRDFTGNETHDLPACSVVLNELRYHVPQ
jgi:hypothetical protein